MKRGLLTLLVAIFALGASLEAPASAPVTQHREVVYSCAFEGHLNMRAQPSFSAKIVGKFRNGPHGAFRLKNLGGWSLVEVNGVVGYVVSRYLQHTPTIPYTGRVGLSWIEGWWETKEMPFWELRIYNNGYWSAWYYRTYYSGYYIMQNNEVKFVTVLHRNANGELEWTGAKGLPNEKGWTLKINARAGKLGECSKIPYDPPELAGMTDTPTIPGHREEAKYVAEEICTYIYEIENPGR